MAAQGWNGVIALNAKPAEGARRRQDAIAGSTNRSTYDQLGDGWPAHALRAGAGPTFPTPERVMTERLPACPAQRGAPAHRHPIRRLVPGADRAMSAHESRCGHAVRRPEWS